MDQLKRTESEQSIEESMDPPSFTRKILREELRISENELNKYQKILAEKAAKIAQKLGDEDNEEEGGVKELEEERKENQSVLHFNPKEQDEENYQHQNSNE